MGGPALLYCVGATKAGTSWLYRRLADHPDCRLSPVKELHYWDSFEPAQRDWQVAAFRRRAAEFARRRDAALAEGRSAQAAGLERQVAALGRLAEVVGGDRTGDAAYRAYLFDGAEGPLVADMTPAYGLLPEGMLRRMVGLLPGAKVVYLMRDPLARLWSHVRMQAERGAKPGETVEARANGLLRRIVLEGKAAHVTDRGDYPGAVARLRAAVPEGALRIEVLERLVEDARFAEFCRWLGLRPVPAEGDRRVHEGVAVRMDESLRAPALRMLRDHYDWAAREFGSLPPAWQANHERALT